MRGAGEGIGSQYFSPKGILVRKIAFLAIAAVCGIATAKSAGDADDGTLSHKQLLQQVVGNTIRFQGPDFEVFEYLSPERVTLGVSTTGGRYRKGDALGFSTKTGPFRALWRIIRGNLLCLENDDPMQSGCVAVVLEPGKIEFHRLDGIVEGPFELLPGNPRKLE